MTDIRRTLLWGIFLASLFFLWESWNRHNGQPSMFAPAPARVAAPAPSAAPIPSSTPVPGGGLPGAAPGAVPATAPIATAPATAASAPLASEQVTVCLLY